MAVAGHHHSLMCWGLRHENRSGAGAPQPGLPARAIGEKQPAQGAVKTGVETRPTGQGRTPTGAAKRIAARAPRRLWKRRQGMRALKLLFHAGVINVGVVEPVAPSMHHRWAARPIRSNQGGPGPRQPGIQPRSGPSPPCRFEAGALRQRGVAAGIDQADLEAGSSPD